jgi:hypothetical protein
MSVPLGCFSVGVGQVRTQSKRRQLIVDDVNLALQIRWGSPIFGYGSGLQRKEPAGAAGAKGSTYVVGAPDPQELLEKAMQASLPKVRAGGGRMPRDGEYRGNLIGRVLGFVHRYHWRAGFCYTGWPWMACSRRFRSIRRGSTSLPCGPPRSVNSAPETQRLWALLT